MRRWHRRALLACTVVAAGTLAFSDQARAILGVGDIVFCTNCSDAWTQAAQLAKQAESAVTEASSYVRQGLQYANQIQNTISLPMTLYTTARADLSSVQGIMGAGSQLSGTGGLNGLFGSVNGLGGQLSNVANMPQQFASWGRMEKDNINSTLKMLGLTNSQRVTDAATLSTEEANSATATGQKAAIQAGNQIAAQGVAQTQKLAQLVAAQTQMQANQFAIQADRQAVSDAALVQFLSPGQMSVSGGPRF
jgi:P-type conjugative transfer protein TrbJ